MTRINPNAKIHFYGDGSVLNLDGRLFFLGAVATDIIAFCCTDTTASQIAQSLQQDYREPISEIASLVEQVLANWQSEGILVCESDQKAVQTSGVRGMFYPRTLTIEITNHCTFACLHCYKVCSPCCDGFVNTEQIVDLVADIAGTVETIHISGGEPTIHPDFDRIAAACRSAAAHLTISSNGSVVSERILNGLRAFDEVQISLYGATPEISDRFTQTPGGFARVAAHLGAIREVSKKLVVSAVLSQQQVGDIDALASLAVSAGADEIKFGPIDPVGRALDNQHQLLLRQSLDVSGAIRCAQSTYGERIKIHQLGGSSHPVSSRHGTSLVPCGAGELAIVISEQGVLRPCEFLPESECGMGVASAYLLGEDRRAATTQVLSRYRDGLSSSGMSPSSVCKYLPSI